MMKNIISKQIYFNLTNINSIRPLDMYLLEIINTTIDSLSETIKVNKNKLNININNKIKIKIAKAVTIELFKFIELCIKCKHKCLFEKKLMEENILKIIL